MDHSSAKEEWKSAKSFDDLCELTARFIEGSLPYCPGYGAETVDEESEPIVPYLSGLNRAGFLTTDSQPGFQDPEWRQRAYVDGYALEHIARRIARLSLYTELHVVVSPPGVAIGFHTPVIVRDFMPHGWGGFTLSEGLEFFEQDCGEDALRQLTNAWSISIVDMKWGRENYLWKNLTREICFSEQPHPELSLGVDFIY